MAAEEVSIGVPLGEEGKDAPVGRVLAHIGPFDFDLLVQDLHARKVESPDGEKYAAYEVTLTAMLPEQMAAALMGMVKDHRVRVRLEPPEDD